MLKKVKADTRLIKAEDCDYESSSIAAAICALSIPFVFKATLGFTESFIQILAICLGAAVLCALVAKRNGRFLIFYPKFVFANMNYALVVGLSVVAAGVGAFLVVLIHQ